MLTPRLIPKALYDKEPGCFSYSPKKRGVFALKKLKSLKKTKINVKS